MKYKLESSLDSNIDEIAININAKSILLFIFLCMCAFTTLCLLNASIINNVCIGFLSENKAVVIHSKK